MVNVEKHDREALKPEIQQSIDQRQVKVDEETDRFGEREGERADEHHHRNLFSGHSLRLNLWLALQPRIVCQRPDPHCPSVKNVATACLRQTEEQEEEAKCGQPHQFPNRPPPVQTFYRKASNEGAEGRPTNSRHPPDTDAIGLFLRLVYICNSGAAGGEHGAADEASDEAECEQHTAVGGIDDRQLKENEGEQGTNINRISTDVRYLGHRCLQNEMVSAKLQEVDFSSEEGIRMGEEEEHTQIIGPSA